MHLTLSASTAALITLAVLTPSTLALSSYNGPKVKHDLAITSKNGPSLDDCLWSLLNEAKLGGNNALQPPKVQGRRAICSNNSAGGCDATLIGWEKSDCVMRADVYYVEGKEAELYQVWPTKGGLCQYAPYSDNAGANWGKVNGFDSCFCEDVSQPGSC